VRWILISAALRWPAVFMRQDTRLLSVRDFVGFICLAADRGKLPPEGTSLRLPVHIIPASLSMYEKQPI